jgi:hypothetical protein
LSTLFQASLIPDQLSKELGDKVSIPIMNRSIDDISDMIKCICIFNSKNKLARKWVGDEGGRNALSCFVTEYVMGIISGMKSLSDNINTFNAEEVVKLTIETAMRKIALGSSIEHIHWAPTQSGKSAFKAVKICAYLAMNMPVILLTKGKKESEELEGKISGYLKGHRFEKKILSVYGNEKRIDMSFMNEKEASVLIIPDSWQKIELAHELFTDGMKYAKRRGRRIAGCALILDEVDVVIDRSENQDQRNEKALKELIRDLEPSLVKVTATPIPVFSNYIDKKPILTTSNKSIENYVGVKNMIHFVDLNRDSLKDGFGEKVKEFSPKNVCKAIIENKLAALFPGGSKKADIIQLKEKFPNVWNKKNPKIPEFNYQCIKLLRKEIGKKGAKGALVLVNTCPWVDPKKKEKKCIFHQASGTQDYFFTLEKGEFIAIVVHAEKVYYRLPGHIYSFECRMSLGELIDQIDSSKKYGLGTAVVVFAYYAMKRSRSFRSNKRVPTSMIMSLGDGQSNENCRQAAGRVTFKGLDVLRRNRKTNKVLMLCPTADFQIIQKYDMLVLEMIQLYKQNMSWKDIYWNLARSSNNFFLHDSKRRTGNYVPDQSKKGRHRQAKIVVPRFEDKESTERICTDLSLVTVDKESNKRNITNSSLVSSDKESTERNSSLVSSDNESIERNSTNSSLASADKESTERSSADLSLAFADNKSIDRNSTDLSLALISNQTVASPTTALMGRIQALKDRLRKTSNPTVGNTHSDDGTKRLSLGPGNGRELIPQGALDPHEIIVDEISDLSVGSSLGEPSNGTPMPNVRVPDTIESITTLLGKRKDPPEPVTKTEENTEKRQMADNHLRVPGTTEVPAREAIKTEEYKRKRYRDDIRSTNRIIDLVDDSDDENDAIDLTLDD